MKNPYNVLGVPSNASKDDVRKAYRKLAMKYHPDKGGDPERFQEIQSAYSELTEEPKTDPGFSFGFRHGDPFDLFDHLYTGARNAPPSLDIYEKNINITIRELCLGGVRNLVIRDKARLCSNCQRTCDNCKGSGMVTRDILAHTHAGQQIRMRRTEPCTRCVNGKIKGKGCSACDGKGQCTREAKISINIEPGMPNGKSFSFSNVLSNMNIKIIAFHPKGAENDFRLEKMDLVHEIKIPFMHTLCDRTITVQHPDDRAPIYVRTSTMDSVPYTGMRHVLPGMGVNTRHNMILEFIVTEYPRVVPDPTAFQGMLLRKLELNTTHNKQE